MEKTAMKLKGAGILLSMALTVGGFVFFAAQSVAFAGGTYTSAGTSYTGTEVFPGTSGGDYLASVATYTGKGPGGQYAGQGVSAFEPVPGSGCFLSPGQAPCPIDGKTDGCLYQAVGGASENTYQGPFDVQTFERVTGPDSRVCIDFDTTDGKPPYNTLGTVVDQATGGTGRFKGTSGRKITSIVHGEIMTMDGDGNGFSWYKSVGH
jgi:hypothetical protein